MLQTEATTTVEGTGESPPMACRKRVKTIDTSLSSQLPSGMEWRLTPTTNARYIEVTSSTTPTGRAISNRFWMDQVQVKSRAIPNYVCASKMLTSSSSSAPAHFAHSLLFPLSLSNAPAATASRFAFPSTTSNGKRFSELLSNYSKSWHDMLAYHVSTQPAIQENGLIYPCFLDWFGRRMIEKVSFDAYIKRMDDLADFLSRFGIYEFEQEVRGNEFILHEWKRFLNPREECYRVDRVALSNLAKSIIAVKQMKLYLTSHWQHKLSLYLAFSDAVFTEHNVSSPSASRALVLRDLHRRNLVERGLRIVGPHIARFLTPAEQRRVASAFRFSDEIVSAFAINTQTKLAAERFLVTSRGLDHEQLMEQVKQRAFLQTYTFLLLRAAAYPKKATLGRAALQAEVILKVMHGGGGDNDCGAAGEDWLHVQIVKSLTKASVFHRAYKKQQASAAAAAAEDSGKAWIEARMSKIIAMEPDLVQGYLKNEFHATLPEFIACFHLKQCLRRANLLDKFDALHAEMVQVARTSLKGWENIRIQVLKALAETPGQQQLDWNKTLLLA